MEFRAVHASVPFRPFCFFNIEGVTRKYGVEGGRPRRSAGEADTRAQSNGEQPGSRSTLREGLAGFVVCVGGGARPGDSDEEGGPRLGSGPLARWAELAAGNWGSVGMRFVEEGEGEEVGGGGGGMVIDGEGESEEEVFEMIGSSVVSAK